MFLTLLFLHAMLSDRGRPAQILPSYRSLRIGYRPRDIASIVCYAVDQLGKCLLPSIVSKGMSLVRDRSALKILYPNRA